jgi:broad specificity phosphatase PhoE
VPAVVLIRHAQASYGGDDYDVLSERGVEQAAAVHAALEGRGVRAARLVSGSMRRQVDSALPWTDAGAELAVDERWNEYDAAGVLAAHSETAAALEGAGAQEVSSRDFQVVLDSALRAWIEAGDGSPAAEPWPAFRARVTGAHADLVAGLGSGETGFAFTSGGAIAACCVAALGLPDAAMVDLNRVTINGGLTKLAAGRSGTSLVSFNEHAHLEPAGLVTYR